MKTLICAFLALIAFETVVTAAPGIDVTAPTPITVDLAGHDGQTHRAVLVRVAQAYDSHALVNGITERDLSADNYAGGFAMRPIDATVSVNTPLIAAVSIGWWVASDEQIDDSIAPLSATKTERGVSLEFEAGLGGGEAKMGYRWQKKGTLYPIAAWDVQASLLHTWWISDSLDHPFGTAAGQDFAGLDASYSHTFWRFNLGVYRRISDAVQNGNDWLVSAGAGFTIY